MSLLIDQISNIDKHEFYSKSIFHERQMNSCPIGCQGCAVSASTTNRGTINYDDLLGFYKDANKHKARLHLTKVEGYDPVFVNYPDAPEIAFAKSVRDALDLGHRIITPVCTTGSWKSDRTKWQLEQLGKLSNQYRRYTYPSGNRGEAFTLSVPREVRPYANGRYNFEEHVSKIIEDIELLTINGDVDVLIYYNSEHDSDYDTAVMLKANTAIGLEGRARERANFIITNFNSNTLPESCYRYPNSVLVSNQGFQVINPKTKEWDFETAVFRDQNEIAAKLVGAKV